MPTNQSAFLAKCVREGVGIAFMPTYMALTDDSIVPLDLGAAIKAKLYVSYHKERASKSPVKATLAYLRTVVFNAKVMPWFGEELRFPSESWNETYASVLDRARPGSQSEVQRAVFG